MVVKRTGFLVKSHSIILAILLITIVGFYLATTFYTGFVVRGNLSITPAVAQPPPLSIQFQIPPDVLSRDVIDFPRISIKGMVEGESLDSFRIESDGVEITVPVTGVRYPSGFVELFPHQAFYPSGSTLLEDGHHTLVVRARTNKGREVTSTKKILVDRQGPILQIQSSTLGMVTVRLADEYSFINPSLPLYYFDTANGVIEKVAGSTSACQGGGKEITCSIALPSPVLPNKVPVVFPYDIVHISQGVPYGNTTPFPIPLTGSKDGETLVHSVYATKPGYGPAVNAWLNHNGELLQSNEENILSLKGPSLLDMTIPACEGTPDPIELNIFTGGTMKYSSDGVGYQQIRQGVLSAIEVVRGTQEYYAAMLAQNRQPPRMGKINVTHYVMDTLAPYLCNSQGHVIGQNPLPPGEEPQLCSDQKLTGGTFGIVPGISDFDEYIGMWQLKFLHVFPEDDPDQDGVYDAVYIKQNYWSNEKSTMKKVYGAAYLSNETSSFKLGVATIGTVKGVIQPKDGYYIVDVALTSQSPTAVRVSVVDNLPKACGFADIRVSSINLALWCISTGNGTTHAHEMGHLLGLADQYTNPLADPANVMHMNGLVLDEVQAARVKAIQCTEKLQPSHTGALTVGQFPIHVQDAFKLDSKCYDKLLDTSPTQTDVHREYCDPIYSGKIGKSEFILQDTIEQLCPITTLDPPLAVTWADIPSIDDPNLIQYCGQTGSNQCKCLPMDGSVSDADPFPTTIATPLGYVYCNPSGTCWPTDDFTDPWDTPVPSSPPAEGTPVSPGTATPIKEKPKPCGIATPAPPADPNAPPYSTPSAPVCGGACEKSSETCTTVMNVQANQWECGCIELTYVSPTDNLVVGEAVLPRNEDASTDTDADTGEAVPVTAENEGMA